MIFATASAAPAGADCRYRDVTAIVLCPIKSRMTGPLVPVSASCDPK